jgi:hypothetical protein
MGTITINPANAAAAAMYEDSRVDDTTDLYEEEADPSPYSIRWFYRKIRLWFFRKIGKAGPLDPYLIISDGDLFYSFPKNVKALDEAIEEAKTGKRVTLTMEEIDKILGL